MKMEKKFEMKQNSLFEKEKIFHLKFTVRFNKKFKCFSLEILFSTADSSQQLHIESADSRR